MSIIQGNAKQGSTRGFYSFPIEQSLRFNDDDSAYLSWTPASAGNRKTWTWSGWVKRGNLGSFQRFFTAKETTSNGESVGLRFDSSDRFDFIFIQDGSSSITGRLVTTQVFRDTSAWYHIVFAQDTTASDGEKMRLWVNGSEVTQFSTETNMTTNHDGYVNKTVEHRLGAESHGTSQTFDGYLAEVNFIDGQALTADSLGELKNGVWIPKDPSGLTYGTNGFRLSFADDAEVEAFNTVLYRGSGAEQSITGMGFQPDLVWTKVRNTSSSHNIFDSVRGVNKRLKSDSTDAEEYRPNGLTSFDSDGFTAISDLGINNTNDTYVAWGWDAGANNAVTGHSSVTYTSKSANQSITGVGFEPDLVWIKDRTSANSHHLFDQVRGAGKRLMSDQTAAESTVTSHTSFDADGFTLGSQGQGITTNNNNYVAWCWKAGDSNVSNNVGSIPSTVRANDTYGFSIVSYTGTGANATVGHSLGAVPSWIIVKDRGSAENWIVYHKDSYDDTTDPAKEFLRLNGTERSNVESTMWNNTAPTSTTFSVGSHTSTNGLNDNFIAYCFSEVSGYSKFDSYTGDGTSDGSLAITTGFRPGWLMIKRTDSGDQWLIKDSSRSPFNPLSGDNLYADASTAEGGGSSTAVEFTSTGFKVTGTDSMVNANGGTYIYMAFAGSYSDYITDYNTDGSIDSRVKANDTYGFSIVSYTGTGTTDTVGHGLSTAPSMVIAKSRDSGSLPWVVYHSSFSGGGDDVIELNNSGAKQTISGYWGTPSTTTFGVLGGGYSHNVSADAYIAYCWAEKAGYSKFGSYTGTGASGNAVTGLGFKPAWLMLKKTEDTNGSWRILDATRSTTNDRNYNLFANLSNSESVDGNGGVSFDSDGFTLNNSGSANANESGKNYIYAAFADTREAAFWLDQSGNDNDWQPVNLDHNDTVADSPTNNFATMNPIDKSTSGAYTFSEGNLVTQAPGTNWVATRASMFVSSGKWYWECRFNAGLMTDIMNGIADVSVANTTNIWEQAGTVLFYNHVGGEIRYNSGTQTSNDYGTLVAGDILGVALDMDAKTISFYKNGSILVNSFSINYTNINTVAPVGVSDVSSVIYDWNFGQGSTFAGGNTDDNGIGDFAYAPPSGYLALCTANLPDPVIDPAQGSSTEDYFGIAGYEGNESTNVITVGFQPDLVWTKRRNNTGNHRLVDSVRGVGKGLASHTTDAELDEPNGVTSFDANGFTLGSDDDYNKSAAATPVYVAWAWKANGSGVSNTDGSITSTVSANTESGFSIVSYTGGGSAGTIGHGLSSKPEMLIVKRTDGGTGGWYVYHHKSDASIPQNKYFELQGIGAVADASWPWNDTSPTSSVFSVGSDINISGSGNTFIAYCFHSVEGFSKFGSYTGNASTDGPFVYTGFRPAFVLIKSSSSAGEWWIYDTQRDTSNQMVRVLRPRTSDAENTSYALYLDCVSNGFKIRTSAAGTNGSGTTHIYMAFAENPFKYSNAR